MSPCAEKHHPNHTHKHGPNCGHTAVRHEGHVDYLHDGHLHHVHGDHVDEHVLPVSASNPARCTPQNRCSHEHGPGCGHEAVPHGDHVDYLVEGRLHHPHGDHCSTMGRSSWPNPLRNLFIEAHFFHARCRPQRQHMLVRGIRLRAMRLLGAREGSSPIIVFLNCGRSSRSPSRICN
jgi:hypothetical protein